MTSKIASATALLATLVTAIFAASASAESVRVLVAEKAEQSWGLEMPPNGHFEITLQESDPGEAEMISDFWMDRSTGQFLANAVEKSGDVRRVAGLALLNVPVPVPTEQLLPGTILSGDDFQVVDLPYGQVGAYAVTSLDHLAGMQVRRVLARGRPVMSQSITEPVIIARGDPVSIEYSKGAMSLTAPGKAISDAHADQPVRVVNLVSNKIVTGIAKPDGKVEIQN
ncbi:flagellar basal body P-ring formation chaperone FlgA [Thioclava atlantica]|uniref:Flagella basal body P-ring formation protein FlgA n=1 Tax=Thioclava atlantica TaxID=1317124 RepID=A0A085TYA4_9RHOB|nr:flagellar basal body P-ring formation chaperone FlgA [Thioclava atlantica]KFE35701.1 flgA protein [Thioclava atlantica]